MKTDEPKPTREEIEAAMRELVKDIQHPPLDAFRARILTMRTSDLIAYLTDAHKLVEELDLAGKSVLDLRNYDPDKMRGVGTAAFFALKDEIDRRIPRCHDENAEMSCFEIFAWSIVAVAHIRNYPRREKPKPCDHGPLCRRKIDRVIWNSNRWPEDTRCDFAAPLPIATVRKS